MDVNKVIVIGRITKDLEIQVTQNNKLCNFSIANNQRKDQVNFFDCVAWGVLAELLCQYCHKGSQIAIEGRLQQDRWEKDGKTQSKVKIVCESIQFLGGKSKTESQSPFSDEDLPF